MDGDTMPDPNAPEIILTENYTVNFEGTPSAISSDGRILQIPAPQAGPAWSGDVVAILSGPDAGTWRRIVTVINPTTYVVDSPLPPGRYAVSLVPAFFQETYTGNTVDMRGSSGAGGLVVGGNHFGLTVTDNHFLGGNMSFKVAANPTNNPAPWGWTHAPCFGATIDGNTVEDAVNGGLVDVEHSPAIQSTKGRVYLSGSLTNTTVVWSAGFLATHPGLPGLNVGDTGSLDPAELRLTTAGNRLVAPAGAPAATALRIHAGNINNIEYVDSIQALSPAQAASAVAAPTGLQLVNDTGFARNDTLTYDPRLTFHAAAGAAGYEYRLNNSSTYLSIGTATTFAPALVQGMNTIWVRAYDVNGVRGPDVSTNVRFDSVAPTAAAPSLSPLSDTGWSADDNLTNLASPEFTIAADPSDVSTLYRDGVPIGQRTGAGPLRDSRVPGDGTYTYTISREDTAGNTSNSAPCVVTVDTTAPAAVQNLVRNANGTVTFWATSSTDLYLAKIVGLTDFFALGTATSFVPSGPGAILVHAVDRAGNVGPDTTLVAGSSPTPPPILTAPLPLPVAVPSGIWLGQDGHDLVSQGPSGRPDRLQDVHVVVNGLRGDAAVTSVQIIGLAGGRWFVNGPARMPKAAWLQAAGATSADLFLGPNRPQATRSLRIVVTYADGATADFTVNGGPVRPRLAMPRAVPARQAALHRAVRTPLWLRAGLFSLKR